jgi:hypothetical protein
MATPADSSDRTLAAARATLVRHPAGGPRSIGRGSAALKTRHYAAKAKRITAAVAAILVAAMVAGLVLDGIGFAGLMLAALAMIAAAALLATYPRLQPPARERLNEGDVRTLVGRTELWLEAQRPALPAPAVELVDRIGLQLDSLGLQLEGVAPDQRAAVEVRKLVGEHLPSMIDSYRRIPGHLRVEDRGGRTPDQQLADGLGKISQEIDQVTRQLAAGDIDNLAIRGRYLDYRYGGALDEATPASGGAA